MQNPEKVHNSRRRLLQYLAASPVLALSAREALAEDPIIWKPFDPNYIIKNPEEALEIFDFEPIAHKNMSLAHWGFMSTGADGEGTYKANRADMGKFVMHSRRLRNPNNCDMTREIFGAKYDAPFFTCPTGRNRMFNPVGEVGVGRATGKHNILQGVATNSSYSVMEVNQARGGKPAMWQLYQQGNWDVSKALIAQAERAGCPALLVTVDGMSARRDLQSLRSVRDSEANCSTCHTVRPDNPKSPILSEATAGNFKGLPKELLEFKDFQRDAYTWDYIKRIRDFTKMQVFVKGITTVEDALECIKLGCGIYISNHGGRNEDTGDSTIACLSRIAPVVKGSAPIFVDSGFRRGMDIVKAISMGATMVGFGRPYIWGLAAFGEAGVDKVLQLTKAELKAAMQQVGANSLSDLNPTMVSRAI